MTKTNTTLTATRNLSQIMSWECCFSQDQRLSKIFDQLNNAKEEKRNSKSKGSREAWANKINNLEEELETALRLEQEMIENNRKLAQGILEDQGYKVKFIGINQEMEQETYNLIFRVEGKD